MIFSSSPTCLSLVRVNPSIPTQFRCRNQKIWGKRISSLKSTGKWKSQLIDDVCWIMISNQLREVMWQNRHISPQQNHVLTKILSKKVACWACARSKASINDSMGGTDVVCRLHHLVNENWPTKEDDILAYERGWPTKEDDILKQRQAILPVSTRRLSASSCSDSRSLTMKSAIFVKSHLKRWLLSLPRGAKNSVNLAILD
jgi:hypothetical protein